MTAPVSVSCSKQTKSLTQTGLRSISGIGTNRRACVHEWGSSRLVGNPYLGIMSGLPVIQRNLFQDGCDAPGGFDPSNQTERHHKRYRNEARCLENVGNHPAFSCTIHEYRA